MFKFVLVSFVTLNLLSSISFSKEIPVKGTPDRDNRTNCDQFGCTDDDVDPREETYEGNTRGGGTFDGGGYSNDSGFRSFQGGFEFDSELGKQCQVFDVHRYDGEGQWIGATREVRCH